MCSSDLVTAKLGSSNFSANCHVCSYCGSSFDGTKGLLPSDEHSIHFRSKSAWILITENTCNGPHSWDELVGMRLCRLCFDYYAARGTLSSSGRPCLTHWAELATSASDQDEVRSVIRLPAPVDSLYVKAAAVAGTARKRREKEDGHEVPQGPPSSKRRFRSACEPQQPRFALSPPASPTPAPPFLPAALAALSAAPSASPLQQAGAAEQIGRAHV